MTEQATTTDELAFIRPYGEQEKQILTAEAVEFLSACEVKDFIKRGHRDVGLDIRKLRVSEYVFLDIRT